MTNLMELKKSMRIPVIGSPMFIISNPKLVIEQCKAGIVGAMPALNARPSSQLDEWLAEITEELASYNAKNPERPAAPFAINQIVHRSNTRLEEDMEICKKIQSTYYYYFTRCKGRDIPRDTKLWWSCIA